MKPFVNLGMTPEALLESVAEAHLLARVAKKDADAFAQFYDRTSKVLFSIARSILLEDSLAEDVLQEVYLQIWEKAEVFDPALGKPISWAIALTRNRCLDRLRAGKRRGAALEAFAKNVDACASESTGSDVESKEAAAIAKQAMSELSDNQKLALELSLLRGLPHSEIAEVMNQPLGTVKAWIRRGIIEIRNRIKKYE